MAGYFHALAQGALHPAPQLHSATILPYSQAQDWKVEASKIAASPAVRTEPIRQSAGATRTAQTTPRAPLETIKRDEPGTSSTQTSETMTNEPQSPRLTELHPMLSSNSQATPDETADAAYARSSIASRTTPKTNQRLSTSVAARSERVAMLQSEFLRTTPAPEVHIHIGRIELTAVSPPAAPRRESESTKKPMSLDEYLERRGSSKRVGTP